MYIRTRFQYEKPKNGYDLTKITYVYVHIRKFSLSRLFVAYYKTKHTLVYGVNVLIYVGSYQINKRQKKFLSTTEDVDLSPWDHYVIMVDKFEP